MLCSSNLSWNNTLIQIFVCSNCNKCDLSSDLLNLLQAKIYIHCPNEKRILDSLSSSLILVSEFLILIFFFLALSKLSFFILHLWILFGLHPHDRMQIWREFSPHWIFCQIIKKKREKISEVFFEKVRFFKKPQILKEKTLYSEFFIPIPPQYLCKTIID